MADYRSLNDQELTQLLKSGSYDAFTEIYNRYWALLYNHALKLLDCDEDAKDIIQGIFISLWTKRIDFDLKSNLAGYLYITTRHRVLNAIRKQKTNEHFIDMLALFMDQHQYTVLDQIHEKELVAIIEKEIESLPSKMRIIFEMSRKQELSHKEIAAELGISDKTVKKQIGNAIKIIRLKLTMSSGIVLLLMNMRQ